MTDDVLSRVLADIDSLLPPGAPSTPDLFGEDWEAEAMRWQPVDRDHHPEQPAPDPLRRYFHDRAVLDRLLDLYPNAHGWAAPSEAVYDLADFDRHFPSLIPPQYRRQQPDPECDGGTVGHFHPQPSAGQHPRALYYWPAIWVAPGRAMIRGAVEAEHTAYLQALTYSAQRTTTNLQHLRDRHQQAQAVIEARRNRNTGPNNPRGADGRARRHQHPRKAAARNASPATQGSATPVVGWREDGTLVVSFDHVWDVGL